MSCSFLETVAIILVCVFPQGVRACERACVCFYYYMLGSLRTDVQ